MMKDKEILQDRAIDDFYGESPEYFDENMKFSYDYIGYMEKLDHLDKKLEILDDDTADFEINTLAIIEAGDKIKEKKKSRMELGLFLVIAMAVLSLYAIAGLAFGFETLLISQAVIMTLIPWIILPVIIIRSRRSGSNA